MPAASTAVIINVFVPFFAVIFILISLATVSPSFGSASTLTVFSSGSSSHLYVTYASSVSSVIVIFVPSVLSKFINGFSVSFVPVYSLLVSNSWAFLSITFTVKVFVPFGIAIDSLYSPVSYTHLRAHET